MPSPDDTKVLLSFGAVQGGFELAMQLRSDIYARAGLKPDSNPYYCYLDAESLRDNPSTKYAYDGGTDKNFMSNKRWKENYKAAMKACSTMILLLTGEWLKSKWCWEELDMLIGMMEKDGSKKLVVVTWPDAAARLRGGSWAERQKGGVERSAQDLQKRLDAIGKNKFATITAGVSGGIIPAKSPGGKLNVFAYSCTEQERNHILAMT